MNKSNRREVGDNVTCHFTTEPTRKLSTEHLSKLSVLVLSPIHKTRTQKENVMSAPEVRIVYGLKTSIFAKYAKDFG